MVINKIGKKMKKIKRRFKRMLFGFFKEEILEAAGYETRGFYPSQAIVHNYVEFETLNLEQIIDIGDMHSYPYNGSKPLDVRIEEAKNYFARNIMDNIRVECKDLLDPQLYGAQRIRLSLMVQKKSNNN